MYHVDVRETKRKNKMNKGFLPKIVDPEIVHKLMQSSKYLPLHLHEVNPDLIEIYTSDIKVGEMKRTTIPNESYFEMETIYHNQRLLGDILYLFNTAKYYWQFYLKLITT